MYIETAIFIYRPVVLYKGDAMLVKVVSYVYGGPDTLMTAAHLKATKWSNITSFRLAI